MTIKQIQKQRPRTFETSARGRNLETIKTLLAEAGATISRSIKIKPGVVKLYLTWPDEP
jgi:hypothetical protein